MSVSSTSVPARASALRTKIANSSSTARDPNRPAGQVGRPRGPRIEHPYCDDPVQAAELAGRSCVRAHDALHHPSPRAACVRGARVRGNRHCGRADAGHGQQVDRAREDPELPGIRLSRRRRVRGGRAGDRHPDARGRRGSSVPLPGHRPAGRMVAEAAGDAANADQHVQLALRGRAGGPDRRAAAGSARPLPARAPERHPVPASGPREQRPRPLPARGAAARQARATTSASPRSPGYRRLRSTSTRPATSGWRVVRRGAVPRRRAAGRSASRSTTVAPTPSSSRAPRRNTAATTRRLAFCTGPGSCPTHPPAPPRGERRRREAQDFRRAKPSI